jgi:hypothetical protein
MVEIIFSGWVIPVIFVAQAVSLCYSLHILPFKIAVVVVTPVATVNAAIFPHCNCL